MGQPRTPVTTPVTTNAYRPPISQNGSQGKPDTSNLLDNPLVAESRNLGPYTVLDMEIYLEEYEYPVELYNGWLVWQQMTDKAERTVVSNLQGMLDISARKVNYGQVLPDQTECRLDEGNDIIPDAALVSWQRLETDFMLHGPNERPLLTQCPELVIESRSPSNWRKQERLKRDKYFDHGTLFVWDVDEPNQCIYVYKSDDRDNAKVYGIDDIIDCPLLPGWQRRVADVFDQRASAEAIVGEVVDEWRNEGKVEGHREGKVEGHREGKVEGHREGIEDVARNMLRQGMDVALIASVTGLAEAEIQAIRKI